MPKFDYIPEIIIPESTPVQLSDNYRIYGKTEFKYTMSTDRLYLEINGHDRSVIVRNNNVNLSDSQYFYTRGGCHYTVEQRDLQTQKWHKIKVLTSGEGTSSENFIFKGYYETAPNLDIEENHKSVEVLQGSSFNFKPKDFFKEKSSAGGTRAKFIRTPDLSILGEQTAEIRVWDQYVLAFGWDNVDNITDAEWESRKWPLNPSHYTSFEVKFNVVKSNQELHKLENSPGFNIKK